MPIDTSEPELPISSSVPSIANRFLRHHGVQQLHAYLGGILRDLGGVTEEVGGVADHVHFLAALKATHCLEDVLRDTKSGSSRWIHDTMKILQESGVFSAALAA